MHCTYEYKCFFFVLTTISVCGKSKSQGNYIALLDNISFVKDITISSFVHSLKKGSTFPFPSIQSFS